MYLLAGLGNPGMKYAATRHNIGFDTITRICDDYNISMNIKKHKALMGQGIIAGQKVLLAMPQTYMNSSGEAVREIADYYKLSMQEIIIIYDDISLPAGQLRIRAKGSAGGHNGIKSIIQCLGSEEFPRVKVGVGQKPQGWDLVDYVLSRFPDGENDIIREALGEAARACECIISEGIEAAMNRFNGKKIKTEG